MAQRNPSWNQENSRLRRIAHNPAGNPRGRIEKPRPAYAFDASKPPRQPPRFATGAWVWHRGAVDTLLDPRCEQSLDGYYAAIAAQRLDDWLSTLSAGVVLHEPAGSPPEEGHAGASEAWKVLTAPFRSLTFERVKSFASGSGIAVLWRCHAVGVNGGAADVEGITVFEFDDEGLIETVVSYWDPASLLIDLAEAEDERLH